MSKWAGLRYQPIITRFGPALLWGTATVTNCYPDHCGVMWKYVKRYQTIGTDCIKCNFIKHFLFFHWPHYQYRNKIPLKQENVAMLYQLETFTTLKFCVLSDRRTWQENIFIYIFIYFFVYFIASIFTYEKALGKQKILTLESHKCAKT